MPPEHADATTIVSSIEKLLDHQNLSPLPTAAAQLRMKALFDKSNVIAATLAVRQRLNAVSRLYDKDAWNAVISSITNVRTAIEIMISMGPTQTPCEGFTQIEAALSKLVPLASA